MRTPLSLLVLLLGSLPLAAEELAPLDPGPQMERLIERYALDEDALRSFYAQPLSDERIARLDEFAAQWQARLSKVDYEGLDADARVDHALLAGHLRHERELLARESQIVKRMLVFLPFVPTLLQLEGDLRRMLPLDARQAAEQFVQVRAQLKERFEALKKAYEAKDLGALPAPYEAVRAARELDAVRALTARWFGFRDGYEPEFGWWVRAPHAAFEQEARALAKWLRESPGGESQGDEAPLVGEVLGREGLLRALRHERIAYEPSELIRIAEREMAWCDAEGVRAAGELGLEGGWPAAVEHVKNLAGPPGTQDDLVASQGREAVAFLRERDLVTVPELCTETWRLQMISPERQKTMPFAYYSDQAMHLAYPSEHMEHDAKRMSMRGNNPHFTRIVTPHELIPGHHLQLFMAARHRPYRERFRTPFLVEGWALHWEMLLYDLGWARGPEDRIGMLFWRRHRCARIIVTLRFHLGEWSTEQMVRYLIDAVGLEPDGARGEVRRYVEGSYGPLYQCAYMLGGLQLRALYQDLVGGGRMTARQFHDAVLREGSIPIDLIRLRLRGGAIARDPAVDWRFGGAGG